MITLKKMAWQFIDEVTGGNRTSDSRLDERNVILKIRQLMNEIMNLTYFSKYQEGDKTPISLYISTYTLTMQHDTALNRAYITLPEFYATLPHNRGIHHIWRTEFPDQSIVPSHQPTSRNLRAGNVANIIYYTLEGVNLYFRNISVEPGDEPESIVVQLIVAGPDSIGINDPLPIIPEHQAEILKRLMAFYKPVAIDLTPNANPNT